MKERDYGRTLLESEPQAYAIAFPPSAAGAGTKASAAASRYVIYRGRGRTASVRGGLGWHAVGAAPSVVDAARVAGVDAGGAPLPSQPAVT